MLIGHDFATVFGGAERIAANVARLFPEADFHAVYGTEEVARRMGVENRFHSIVGLPGPLASRFRLLAPFYPGLIDRHRLPATDLLFTSSFAYAQGLRTENDAPHLCWSVSPIRFAWSMYESYAEEWAPTRLRRFAFDRVVERTRRWDREAAGRVDRYLAMSSHIARQVEQYYGREAEVLWPPVETDNFTPSGSEPGDYFLFFGRLIEPYKQPTIVVEAFDRLPGEKLRIAGDGPERDRLEWIAPSNVEFLGRLDDDELIPQIQGCKGVIFPSQDDFGLVPVEAMACGRPVIAYAGGGALDTVLDGVTGVLFEEQSIDCLVAALSEFDPGDYDPDRIREHAERWSPGVFERRLREEIAITLGGATPVDAAPGTAAGTGAGEVRGG